VSVLRLSFLAIALGCAVLGVYLAVESRSEARLERASADVAAGRTQAALHELTGVDDADGRAARLRGAAYLAAGRLGPALANLRAAARRDPNNWLAQRDYAIVLLRTGDRARAQRRMRAALALNPRMPLPPGFVPRKRQ
jgi:Flp pilus assembly protein TadD